MIPVAHQRATPSLSGSDHPLIGPGQKVPFVLVTSLFFLWGIPNNLNDVLIGQFMKSFTLSRFEAGLVQSAFYLGYFLLAIRSSQHRVGRVGHHLFGLDRALDHLSDQLLHVSHVPYDLCARSTRSRCQHQDWGIHPRNGYRRRGSPDSGYRTNLGGEPQYRSRLRRATSRVCMRRSFPASGPHALSEL
jgi:hypothetical protein